MWPSLTPKECSIVIFCVWMCFMVVTTSWKSFEYLSNVIAPIILSQWYLIRVGVSFTWARAYVCVKVCRVCAARDSVTRVTVSENSTRLDVPLTGLVLPFSHNAATLFLYLSRSLLLLSYLLLAPTPMHWMRTRTRPLSPHLDKSDRVLKWTPHSVAVRKE